MIGDQFDQKNHNISHVKYKKYIENIISYYFEFVMITNKLLYVYC